MLEFLFGIFILLHGLVHLWYVVLSQRWVEFRSEMGWTGVSWLLSPLLGSVATRWMSTVSYGLAALGFVAGSIGLLARQEWWRPVMVVTAAFSAAIVLLFWDGGVRMLVEKGLVGFLIDLAILFALLAFGWPSVAS